jgi:hypothetical protein
MLKTKLPLYLALLLLTQCSKCKHDDPQPQPPTPLEQLPAETQSGAGTLGCLVNGDAFVAPVSALAFGEWIALDKLGISATKMGTHNLVNFSILLHGSLRDNQQFSFLANGPSNTAPTYTAGLNEFTAGYTATSCYYNGVYIKSGQLTLLKCDLVARIAAGRFSFTLPPAPGSGCDTLRVTDGRFDIRF